MDPRPSPDLDALAERALQRLRAAAPEVAQRLDDPAAMARYQRVAIASDFAIDTLQRQPELLTGLLQDDDIALPAPALTADNRSDWQRLLRRYRAAQSTRLVWRAVHGLDDVDTVLAGTTALAETCLQVALAALEEEFRARSGQVRDGDGQVVRLVVFALGKLGGSELNFSSDIDLVYGYADDGQSDGARKLDAGDYFARLGQQLARLLDERTADGFCHRVDLRLRPFGKAGRVAWSFAAMEQYFQREGRDWERYAWQKARPVAGDCEAGEAFLVALRPFIYRRYLDYGALDGLREMKAAIAAEVERKELADDIKRGPGGIREIEFLAQALQLIRGGREPSLRGRRLLPALQALVRNQHIDADTGQTLAHAYRFLRRLENRLQMLRDAQTHVLPDDAMDRARIADGLGYPDWNALRDVLAAQRAQVASEFDALLAPRRRSAKPGALALFWRGLSTTADERNAADDVERLAAAGFQDAAAMAGLLRDFARAPAVDGLSDSARARLDRVLPALLEAAAASDQPDSALRRLLPLLHNILRRTSYLALLDEQPAALARLVDVLAHSGFLAERVANYPLLLDELLDVRIGGPLPTRAQIDRECAAMVASDDPEAALHALNEKRQALSFRMALATLDGRQSGQDSARQLAWLADAVVTAVLALAQAEMQRAHGSVAGARFAVLGYGSLGGEELGFGSDLDLVFLYDVDRAPGEGEPQSDGARPLDVSRWCARLAQKVVALLGMVTGAGRLYEVDVRLRPDGAKGLLVSTLAAYAEYQHARAWTWEHQALVRARGVAGDAALRDAFAQVRAQILGKARDTHTLREHVASMRARMRRELDRSAGAGGTGARFDLKHGVGGLVDLEFLLQFMVLRDAAAQPALLAPRDTPGLLAALRKTGALDAAGSAALLDAHACLLEASLRCTLDRRSRIVAESEAITAAREAVITATRRQSLDFSGAGGETQSGN